jgi:hypothetical protein
MNVGFINRSLEMLLFCYYFYAQTDAMLRSIGLGGKRDPVEAAMRN